MRGDWLPAGQELTKELTGEQIETFRGHRSFVVVKKRWIVERSLAWMTFHRRLNRDYELLPDTTEAWVTLTFIRLMIRRLSQLRVHTPAYSLSKQPLTSTLAIG